MESIKPIETPPDVKSEAKWYCVVTSSGQWRRAELGLYAAGLRTFLPKVKKWISHARTKTAVERPLLGRYLFVECSTDFDFYKVRETHGIDAFVTESAIDCDGNHVYRPAPFPSHWVENFRMRYMAGEWDFVTNRTGVFLGSDGKPTSRTNELPIGARVKLMEGEFADMLATVTEKQGKRGKMIVFKLKGENRYGSLHVDNVRAAWDWNEKVSAA